MGRKGKETTVEERNIIIQLHKQGKRLSEISSIISRPRSTIQSIISRFKNRNSVDNSHRNGRPRILSGNDQRFIIRSVKKNPKISVPDIKAEMNQRGILVSASTIRNVLRESGYHGRVSRKKFWVNKINREKRLEFAKKYQNKGLEFWNRVIWSDESKFNIFGSDGRRMVWRQKNKELDPNNLIPTVKHGGGSVMVWGCMSASGVGFLHIIETSMTHRIYIDILKQKLAISAQKLSIENNFIFQQDNDPKHTAYNTKEWLLYNVPDQLHTPPQSPDLNPIEHLWSILEDAVRKQQVSNRDEFIKVLQKEWENISVEITKKLVHSIPRRLQAVIESKGYPTKY